MPTYATITGRVTLHGRTTGLAGSVEAYPETHDRVLALDDRVTLGVDSVQVDPTDGEFAESLKIPIVPEVLWTLRFVPEDRIKGTYDLGTFEITASADLADLVPVVLTGVTETRAQSFANLAAQAGVSAGLATSEADRATAAAGTAAVSAASLVRAEVKADADRAETAADFASAVAGADTADDLIVALDANSASTFRQQQDARLTATVATETTQKMVGDARFAKTTRVPTLIVEKEFPQAGNDYQPVWRDGNTLYGQSQTPANPLLMGPRLGKSLDGGETWTDLGAMPSVIGSGRFIKLTDGTLITGTTELIGRIYRSTNDGASWTHTHTYRAATVPMAAQSFAEDETTGDVYYGEYWYSYDNPVYTTIRVYRSTNQGLTWTVFHEFPTFKADPINGIHHIHSVQWDPIGQRVYILTGDRVPKAGIYRVNADRTGVEPVILNEHITSPNDDAARAIGLMFFPTHIAWITDSGDGEIYRMNRDQLGLPSPTASLVIRIGTTGYFSIRAKSDNTRWLCTTTPNGGTPADDAVHVYSVEDNGATVYEAATFGQGTGTGVQVTVGPVGMAHKHGDDFYLQSNQYEYPWAIKGRIALGQTATKRPTKAVVARPVPVIPQGPVDGVPNMPRWLARDAVTVPSGRVVGAVFVPERDIIVTKVDLRAIAGSLGAATVSRVGLYSLNANLLGTLVASTANDTTLGTANQINYSRPLSATVTLLKGQQYALGLLMVHTGAPTVLGWQTAATSSPPGFDLRPLFIFNSTAGQTDLPASGFSFQSSGVGAPYLWLS